MKTLEQIKNDYAINAGYLSWKSLLAVLLFDLDFICKHENEVMKIYAMECLKLASDNVTTVHHKIQTRENIINAIHFTKHSITNENNIIK